MRRLILTFAFATAASSQTPPRPEGRPPITVKIEQSPERIGTTLFKLVIPTVLGAGLTLFGVWLTNQHNAAQNRANREHQLEVERGKGENCGGSEKPR